MGLTRELSLYVKNKRFGDFPEEAVKTAKMGIMDCLGVGIAGIKDDCVDILTGYVMEQGCSPDCRVPGKLLKTSAPLSALLTGTMTHALDYDDICASMHGHPSVPLVPVILALGDQLNISGEAAIEAYIVGFEAEGKAGLYLGGLPYERGWHYTMTVGVIGAATAAAKILNLSEEQIMMALGIAASMTGGLRQNFGTMTKPLHAGLAAHNGIIAAQLARRGFTADPGILEAPYGFKKVISEGESMSEEAVIERLNSDHLEILNPGIGFKKYPCCYMSHNAIDAALELINKDDVKPGEVERVRVRVAPIVPKELIHKCPATPLEGKFSMEYAMAIALLDRRVGLAQFADEKIKSEEVISLMQKVDMTPHSDNRFEAEVEIELKNGKLLKNAVLVPRGYPTNPLSWDELEEKFQECMSTYFAPHVSKKCVQILRSLEATEGLQELTEALTDI